MRGLGRKYFDKDRDFRIPVLYLKYSYLFHHSNFHYLHLFNFKEIFPKLIRDFKTGGTLSANDHAFLEFTVLRHIDHIWSNIRSLKFRKASFQLFKEIVSRIPWEIALRDKRAEQKWEIFKELFHVAQDLSILRN